MKAAEYIKEYEKFLVEDKEPSIAISGVIIMLLEEIPKLCQTRKAKLPDAVLAVVREVNQKWEAIYRRIPEDERRSVRKDGFARIFRNRMSAGLCAILDSHGLLKVEDD
jgi:hypothetical protein